MYAPNAQFKPNQLLTLLMNVFFTELVFKCNWIFQTSLITIIFFYGKYAYNLSLNQQQKVEKLIAPE
jgi:hypothetical protein